MTSLKFISMSFILPAIIASRLRSRATSPKGVQSIDSTSHDDFLQKNQNTDYADLIRSNPYMSYNYNNSLWDNVGDLFGFNTQQDKLRLQYGQAAADYDAQVQQLIQENKFNSAAQMSMRERQAGLNPDLLGLQGEPAAEFAQEQTSPDASGVGITPDQVGNFMANVVSTAFQFYQGFQGVRAASLENQGKELSNLSQAFDLSSGYARTLVSRDLESGSQEFSQPIYPEKISLANKQSLDRNYMIARHSMQNVADYWSWRKSANQGVKDVAFQELSRYQPDRFGIDLNDPEKTLSDFVLPIVELMDKTFLQKSKNAEKSSELESQEITNQQEYAENIDPSQQAASENAANKESESKSKFANDLNSTLRGVVSNLSKKAKGGDNFAAALLVAISFFMNSNISLGGIQNKHYDVNKTNVIVPGQSQ